MGIKISIIIPVYNAERCLEECVGSILSQIFSDFEIILVDDGSKDNSLAVCRTIAERDDRIKVYHKENGGACSARAFGVQKATGEYINFVDADDSIPPTALSDLYQRVKENDLDIAEGASYFFSCKGETRVSSYAQVGEYDSFDYIKFLFQGRCNVGPWGTLYRKELFGEETFSLDRDVRINEDLYMNICLGIRAKRIGIYNDIIVYNYKENQTSVTHNYSFSSVLPQQHLLERMYDVLSGAGLFDNFASAYYSYAIRFLASGCFHNKRFLRNKFVKDTAKIARKHITSFKDKSLCSLMRHPVLYPIFFLINKLRRIYSQI